jgi:hypothetical protein
MRLLNKHQYEFVIKILVQISGGNRSDKRSRIQVFWVGLEPHGTVVHDRFRSLVAVGWSCDYQNDLSSSPGIYNEIDLSDKQGKWNIFSSLVLALSLV